jgi:hypothetical protein
MIEINGAEFALLLATRNIDYAQTAEELAQAVEANSIEVEAVLTSLVQKRILEPCDSFDGTRYIYAANDEAQRIYAMIHGRQDDGRLRRAVAEF